MTKSTFLINYSVYNNQSILIKKGIMKVKNKSTKFEAQASFENYLKKKYDDFNKLVIHSCRKQDSFSDLFSDFSKMFQ